MNTDDSRGRGVGAVNREEMGERGRSIGWTERALDAAGGEAFIQYNSACTYAVLGESGRAFDLLERAVALGWGDRAWIENDADLASLRDQPRFARLMQQLDIGHP